MQGRRTFQDDVAAPGLHQPGVTHELDRVAETLQPDPRVTQTRRAGEKSSECGVERKKSTQRKGG